MEFRVFLSSTFAEFHELRNRLTEGLFRKLHAYCLDQGAIFEPIDLRWGVTSDVSAAQNTVPVCLAEVDRCVVRRSKPCFLLFVGGRSGWRPLPSLIEPGDFQDLLANCSDDSQRQTIRDWYRRDDNRLEPAFCLQGQDLTPHGASWEEIEKDLFGMIETAALKAGLDAVLAQMASITLQELRRAVALGGEGVVSFVAVRSDAEGVVDSQLEALLSEAVSASSGRIIKFDDTEAGIAAVEKELFERMRSEIDAELVQARSVSPDKAEALRHAAFSSERRAAMVGRRGLLDEITRCKEGFVLVAGAGGIGKTSIMASVAELSEGRADSVVVQRFVGATPDSLNPEFLITSLAQELFAKGDPGAQAEVGINASEFARLEASIRSFPAQQHIRILIDGLDQLLLNSDSEFWTRLAGPWPDNVQFILSCADGEIRHHLQGYLAGLRVFEIGGLTRDQQLEAIGARLALDGRKLQPAQYEDLSSRLTQAATPLTLRLLCEVLRPLRSFDKIEPGLELTLESVLAFLINRLRKEGHGPELVAASFGYLSAARLGLSELELRKLLFSDERTRQEFLALHPKSPQTEELPGIVWSRLRNQIDYLLRETNSRGGTLLTFYHRIVSEVVQKIFLEQDHRNRFIQIADYFDKQSHAPDQENERKLMELPHALAAAGAVDRLERLLCDPAFIIAKCRINQSNDLLADFQRLRLNTPHSRMLERFLRKSAYLLRRGRAGWPADRILLQLALDRPYGDPVQEVFSVFLERCPQHIYLLRQVWPETGEGMGVLEGHEGDVLGYFAWDADLGVSWARDATIRIWRLSDGECQKVFQPGYVPKDVWSLDADRLLAWSDSEISICSRKKGRKISAVPPPEGAVWSGAARAKGVAFFLASNGHLYRLNPDVSDALECVADAQILEPDPDGRAGRAHSCALHMGADSFLAYELGGSLYVHLLAQAEQRQLVARDVSEVLYVERGAIALTRQNELLAWSATHGDVRRIKPMLEETAEDGMSPWRLKQLEGAVMAYTSVIPPKGGKRNVLIFGGSADVAGCGVIERLETGGLQATQWDGAGQEDALAALAEPAGLLRRAVRNEDDRTVFDGAFSKGSQIFLGALTPEAQSAPIRHLRECQNIADLRLLADNQLVAHRTGSSNDAGLYFFDTRDGSLLKRLEGESFRSEEDRKNFSGSSGLSRINGMIVMNELIVTWGFGDCLHIWDGLRDEPLRTLVMQGTMEIFDAIRIRSITSHLDNRIVAMTSRGFLVSYDPVANTAHLLETGANRADYARRYEHWGLRNTSHGLAWFFRNYPISFWSHDQLFSPSGSRVARQFKYSGFDPNQPRQILAASSAPQAQVRDIIPLDGVHFAAIQANQVIEIFSTDCETPVARLEGEGVCLAPGGDYITWSSTGGVRRWASARPPGGMVDPDGQGPGLEKDGHGPGGDERIPSVTWSAEPPATARLEGGALLDEQAFLTWASDRRFRVFDLARGEPLLEVTQLEAIFERPSFISHQRHPHEEGRAASNGWQAWSTDRVLGLSRDAAEAPLALWHGNERLRVCDIREDGVIAAVTQTGRAILLKLHLDLLPADLPLPVTDQHAAQLSGRSIEPITRRLVHRFHALKSLGASREASVIAQKISSNQARMRALNIPVDPHPDKAAERAGHLSNRAGAGPGVQTSMRVTGRIGFAFSYPDRRFLSPYKISLRR